MHQYDAAAQSLTAKVEKIAEQISQQALRNAPGVEPFFIDNVFQAVENAAGDVADSVERAVNAGVNATHDLINDVATLVHNAATQDVIIHATGDLVQVVTDHTAAIHNIANVTLENVLAVATPGLLDDVGFAPDIEGQKATAASRAQARASSAQLLQARRALLREKSNALSAQTAAKRTEIREKIAAARERLTVPGPRSGGK